MILSKSFFFDILTVFHDYIRNMYKSTIRYSSIFLIGVNIKFNIFNIRDYMGDKMIRLIIDYTRKTPTPNIWLISVEEIFFFSICRKAFLDENITLMNESFLWRYFTVGCQFIYSFHNSRNERSECLFLFLCGLNYL